MFDPYKFILNLNRLAAHKPAQEALLTELLSEDTGAIAPTVIAVAIAEGGPIGRILADVLRRQPNTTLCFEIIQLLPRDTVALRDLALEVHQQMLCALGAARNVLDENPALSQTFRSGFEFRRKSTPIEAVHEISAIFDGANLTRQNLSLTELLPEYASELAEVSTCFFALGRYKDALPLAAEALEIYRCLATNHPETFQADVVGLVRHVCLILQALGRRNEALHHLRGAVPILRVWAEQKPETFKKDLIHALITQANLLSGLGRCREAIGHIKDALEICQSSGVQQSDVFGPDIALSLLSTAAIISELGSHVEALDLAHQSLVIYRELAMASPDRFRPELGTALNNLGVMLGNAGQPQEGIVACEEALEISRMLSAQDSNEFAAHEVVSLNNLAKLLHDLNRNEHALEKVQEAVAICLRLRREHDRDFRSETATTLNTCGVMLEACGRNKEAQDCYRESARIFDELTSQYPEAFEKRAKDVDGNLMLLLNETRIFQHPDVYQAPAQSWSASPQPGQNTLVTRAQENGLPAALLAASSNHLSPAEYEHVKGLLGSAETSKQVVANIKGVLLMRMDEKTEALNVYRSFMLLDGSHHLRDNLPPLVLTNYATALLLNGNVAGCEDVLLEVERKTGAHPAAVDLRLAISKWRGALSFRERIGIALGLQIPSVDLGRQPGRIIDSI